MNTPRVNQALTPRREYVSRTGTFRGGQLRPVMCTFVDGREAGVLSQEITMELAPIQGRLVTQVTGELTAVAVPVEAVDALLNPEADYPGLREVVRQKLLSQPALFGLEDDNLLAQALEINPRRVGGAFRVQTGACVAHNCAVNHLRRRRYLYATTLPHSVRQITPAIIGRTVLEMFNGVLDPDDRINGAVALTLPTLKLPIDGFGRAATATAQSGPIAVEESGGVTETYQSAGNTNATGGNSFYVRTNAVDGSPDIWANFNGIQAGEIAISDFYTAEKADDIVRIMRQIADANPEYAEESVLRWAYGFAIDPGSVPFVLAERSAPFGRSIVSATDTSGVNNEVIRSDGVLRLSFSVPVPKTELGYYVITFAVMKPDETLGTQPHPYLSNVLKATNFAAEQLRTLDPVPVYMRDLDTFVPTADETRRAFYTGLNEVKRNYVSYGLSRLMPANTVDSRTAVWQYKLPLSQYAAGGLTEAEVSESILYPAVLDHYPFTLNGPTDHAVTYGVVSSLSVMSPLVVGASPVETLKVLDTENLLE